MKADLANVTASARRVTCGVSEVAGRVNGMEELTDSERGQFMVHTESSVYVCILTADGHRLRRTPGHGLGSVAGLPPVGPVSELRSDNSELVLLHIGLCHVGERGEFWIRMPESQSGIPAGYLATTRMTTIVRRIERIERMA